MVLIPPNFARKRTTSYHPSYPVTLYHNHRTWPEMCGVPQWRGDTAALYPDMSSWSQVWQQPCQCHQCFPQVCESRGASCHGSQRSIHLPTSSQPEGGVYRWVVSHNVREWRFYVILVPFTVPHSEAWLLNWYIHIFLGHCNNLWVCISFVSSEDI